MKTKALTILTILALSLSSIAQEKYTDYADADKTDVFYDQFNDNRNEWKVGKDKLYGLKGEIVDGLYYMEVYKKNNYPRSWQWIYFDMQKDFEIEVSIKHLEEKHIAENTDLFMGCTMYGFKGYLVCFSREGKITIWFANGRGSDYDKIREATYSNAFKVGQFNVFTFRRVGGMAYLFINKKLVQEFPYKPFPSSYFGIGLESMSKVVLDYYRISFLKTEKPNEPSVITLIEPELKRGFKQIKDENVRVYGKVTDQEGVSEVKINGAYVSLNNQYFDQYLSFPYGQHKVAIDVYDNKGEKTSKTFTIERKKEEVIATSEKTEFSGAGRYYALIIGISEYNDPDVNDLDYPVSDAKALHQIITKYYDFDHADVVLLQNPGRARIIDAIDGLKDKVSENDNLLIFFAGHGYWDDKHELGYWLPSDARKNSTANWLRNTTVQSYISAIKSKHTLLIADACFSGGIFKTRKAFHDAPQSIEKLYQLPSRKAMTSGTLKEVPDKSAFTEYMLKRLEQNNEKYLSAYDLFVSFRTAVLNNSPNVPQYGTIQNAGDEGGDFVFIKN